MTENSPMSYEVGKDSKIFIYWYDKMIRIVSGPNGKALLQKLEVADDRKRQQLLAQVTGNLKRKKDGDTQTLVIHGVHHTRLMK